MNSPLSCTCHTCNTRHTFPASRQGKQEPCSHCGALLTLPSSSPPLLLQLALHGKEIQPEEIPLLMEQWRELLAKNPMADVMEVLRNHPGMTEEKIKKLDIARTLWLHRSNEKRFAAAALHLNWVSKEAVDEAFDLQKQLFHKTEKLMDLGDILIKRGHLTRNQKESILKALEKSRETEAIPSQTAESSPAKREDLADKPMQAQKFSQEIPSQFPLLDKALTLYITEDHMEAFIQAKSPLPPGTTAEQILSWLREKNVIYGLIDTSLMEGFIKFDMVRQSRFKIAQGKPPIPGKEGRVLIHFPSEFLSSGAVLSEDGRIDFRERGTIPHVPQASLLGEKTPAIKGKNGTDVFGNLLVVPEVKDPAFKPGTGVYTSEDRTKIFAKISGQPILRPSGEISVLDEILIKGDVGYDTGHIQYEGKVRILGKLPAGFRVEARQVTVESVDGGLILSKGDVVVTGGVTEGEIRGEGEIRARFINKSKIRTLGNVLVTGEIIDSDIACSGSCNIRLGKIIGSSIAAFQGIEAHTIGTEVSPPSLLQIGIDLPFEQKLAEADRKLQGKEATVTEKKKKIQDLAAEEKSILAGITRMAQIQDRSGLRLQQILRGDLEAAETTPKEAEKLAEELQQAIQAAEKKLEDFFTRQDAMDTEKKEAEEEQLQAEQDRNQALHEKELLEKYSGQRQPIALLKINGKAYPGTRIIGSHAQATLQEICSTAMIREMEVEGSGGKEYVIRIVRQKSG